MNQPVHKPGTKPQAKMDGRRARHEARRGELLEAAADYVVHNGLAGLSVRPLAAALGLSHRTLLYHFGSKEELVVEVLGLIRTRDKKRIRAHLQSAEVSSPTDLFRTAWAYFSSADRIDYIHLFHEVFVLGLHGPPYDAWVESMVASRTQMIAMALAFQGWPEDRAEAAATLIIASVRGLQLNLLATGDRDGTDTAFEELIRLLDTQLTH